MPWNWLLKILNVRHSTKEDETSTESHIVEDSFLLINKEEFHQAENKQYETEEKVKINISCDADLQEHLNDGDAFEHKALIKHQIKQQDEEIRQQKDDKKLKLQEEPFNPEQLFNVVPKTQKERRQVQKEMRKIELQAQRKRLDAKEQVREEIRRKKTSGRR